MRIVLGFTLIEIIIVVAIVGILSLITIPFYRDHIKKTNDIACLAEMKTYASLYASEKISKGNITNLPLASTLRSCIFVAPDDFSAVILNASALRGSGKIISCDVNDKAVCEIN